MKGFGNFTNQGTANFLKSSVIIAGDLFTSSTICKITVDVAGTRPPRLRKWTYQINPGARSYL
jgi:hypothetical protein